MLNEKPIFFNGYDDKLFGVEHVPESGPLDKALVFCHAYAEEKLWSHRVFVSMARELAKRGYMVFRFDYKGYGDSNGCFSECNVTSYIKDIQSAVSYLKSQYHNLQDIGLLGHRLGATLGLHAFNSLDINGPLLLWDPIIDGERYMQEFLRSNLATQLAVYGEIRETRERLVERLNNNELVNVEGYDLNKAQFDSISNLNMMHIDPPVSSRSLLLQVGRNDKPKKNFVDLSKYLQADLRCVVEEPFWREIKRFYFEAKNMSDTTMEWLGVSP